MREEKGLFTEDGGCIANPADRVGMADRTRPKEDEQKENERAGSRTDDFLTKHPRLIQELEGAREDWAEERLVEEAKSIIQRSSLRLYYTQGSTSTVPA